MPISAEEVLAEIGPVQETLKAHDGVVTVIDTSEGVIMLSLMVAALAVPQHQ